MPLAFRTRLLHQHTLSPPHLVRPDSAFSALPAYLLSHSLASSRIVAFAVPLLPLSPLQSRAMVLYLIGLGLGDEKDITLKGLEAIKRCTCVFLEHYTAVLGADTEAGAAEGAGKRRLEELYGKPVLVADREMVESQAEQIIGRAKEEDVAFLVVGDPFASVTRCTLIERVRRER